MAKVYELTGTKITYEEVPAEARAITLTVPTNMGINAKGPDLVA